MPPKRRPRPSSFTNEVATEVVTRSRLLTSNVLQPTNVENNTIPEDPNNISSNSQIEVTPPANSQAPTRKKGRGKAKGLAVLARMKEGKKIGGIIIDDNNPLPVGPAENIFKMEIGIITRMLAPLQKFYWKDMTKEDKEPLFEKLKNEFDVSLDDEHARSVVDAAMGSRFRNYKYRCHQHFKTFDEFGEALKNSLADVVLRDWVPLCHHFNSQKYKDQSAANFANRQKRKGTHVLGAKSFCQRLYEMQSLSQQKEDREENLEENPDEEQSEDGQESGDELVEIQLYKITHFKDDKWVNTESQENYDKMKAKRREAIEKGIDITGAEIVQSVLKPKSAYAFGIQPQSMMNKFSFQKSAREEELEKKVEEQDKKIELLQSKLDQIIARVDAFPGSNSSSSSPME